MLVVADLTGVAADELVGEIGIDAARIEQVDPVLHFGALDLERRELDLPLLMQPRIIAPGEQPVRPEQRIAREIGDHENSERRRDRGTQNVDNCSWTRRHEVR